MSTSSFPLCLPQYLYIITTHVSPMSPSCHHSCYSCLHLTTTCVVPIPSHWPSMPTTCICHHPCLHVAGHLCHPCLHLTTTHVARASMLLATHITCDAMSLATHVSHVSVSAMSSHVSMSPPPTSPVSPPHHHPHCPHPFTSPAICTYHPHHLHCHVADHPRQPYLHLATTHLAPSPSHVAGLKLPLLCPPYTPTLRPPCRQTSPLAHGLCSPACAPSPSLPHPPLWCSSTHPCPWRTCRARQHVCHHHCPHCPTPLSAHWPSHPFTHPQVYCRNNLCHHHLRIQIQRKYDDTCLANPKFHD